MEPVTERESNPEQPCEVAVTISGRFFVKKFIKYQIINCSIIK